MKRVDQLSDEDLAILSRLRSEKLIRVHITSSNESTLLYKGVRLDGLVRFDVEKPQIDPQNLDKAFLGAIVFTAMLPYPPDVHALVERFEISTASTEAAAGGIGRPRL